MLWWHSVQVLALLLPMFFCGACSTNIHQDIAILEQDNPIKA